jgi:plastocyanin
MNRRHLTLAILLLALGLALAGCGGDDEDDGGGEAVATTEASTGGDTGGDTGEGGGTTLNGSVGPGFVISLDGTDGLTAGDYTIAVNDQSSEHNFHLTGPGGVDVATDVSGEGEESFDVTLEAGEYTFVCDPHAAQMKGSFTVG